MIPPTAPIRLIMAFAFERSGFTVTSGISATAGERKVDMETRVMRSAAMNMMSAEGFSFVSLFTHALRAGTT